MNGTGIWNATFIRLVIFDLLAQFGLYLVNPIVSNYAVAMGASLATAGFLAGLQSLSSLVCRPFGGFAFNKIARKPLLIVSVVMFAASSLACVFFQMVGLLGFSRIVAGAAFVIKSVLVVSLTAAAVPCERLGQGIGWIGLTSVVAQAIGPSIGSWLGLSFGYPISFLASTLLFVFAIAVACSLGTVQNEAGVCAREGEENNVATDRSSKAGERKRIFCFKVLPVSGLAFLVSLVFGAVMGLVLLACEQRGIQNASLFFLAYAIVACAVRPTACRLYDAWGLSRVFAPMVLFTCLSMVVLALANTVVGVIVAGILLALGQGSLYPCLQAESVKDVAEDEASLAANTFYIGPDAGMAIGPIVSGFALQGFGATAMFLMNCGIGVITIILYYVYRHRVRLRHAARQRASSGL